MDATKYPTALSSAFDPTMMLRICLIDASPNHTSVLRASRSLSSLIEVETKFPWGERELSLLSRLATSVSDTTFRDCYVDCPSRGYPLTTHDHWLRRRDEVWELKAPRLFQRMGLPHSPRSDAAHVTEYREFALPEEICRYLEETGFLAAGRLRQQTLTASLMEAAFQDVCSLTTHRRTFLLGSSSGDNSSVTVVLDTVMESGYRVGELELVVSAVDADVDAARARLDDCARSLGLDTASSIPGKVLYSIHQGNPVHWRALMASDYIRSKAVDFSTITGVRAGGQ